MAETRLAEHLAGLELLRAQGEPDGGREACLVVLADDLRRLPVWLRHRKDLLLHSVLIADAQPGSEIKARLPACHGDPRLECGLASLADLPEDVDLVFLHPREYLVRVASMALPLIATRKIWLAGDVEAPLRGRTPLPSYYDDNSEKLERAYALLAEPEDRAAFAGRVKALITGDPGWMPIAPHFEYQHPGVRPELGDVMLDGGVSDMVGAQLEFCARVGPRGRIHGFEPISWMAGKAAEQLAGLPQYDLRCAGLAENDGEADFASLRDSSHIGAQAGAEVEKCRLLAIDGFVEREGIGRVDCIKLDIEGAEPAALRGARQVIQRDAPKLIICLYHKPSDLYEIPLLIEAMAPGYEMHAAHSSAGFTDTILYARKPRREAPC